MRLLSIHVKVKPAVLPDLAIRRQSHYFIYRPRVLLVLEDWNEENVGVCGQEMEDIYCHRHANFIVVISYGREWDRICVILKRIMLATSSSRGRLISTRLQDLHELHLAAVTDRAFLCS